MNKRFELFDDGAAKNANSDQALLRRMELLEQRILSPPLRNNKPSEEIGLDHIVCIHQNSGSQHSFSFEQTSGILCAPAGSPSQSHSLQQANQLVDDHLRVIGQKLHISTTSGVQECKLDQVAKDENIDCTIESNNRPLSSNSLPSSVSATIMSCPNSASHETLITAHLDRRNSSTMSKSTPPKKPLLSLPPSARSVAPPSDAIVAGDVGNIANKRKSFMPTKRTLTSIIDSCTQSEIKKNRVGDDDKKESRSVSPHVAGLENSISAHHTNNPKGSIHDVNVPILIIDNAAATSSIDQFQTSRGSLSNPPFPVPSAYPTKKTSVKATTSNNTVITTFFHRASNKTGINVSSENKTSSANQATVNEIKSSTKLMVPISNGSTLSNDTDTTFIHSLQNENVSLKAEISSLQALLKDKMDQLNAISNNQTIVHAHLKAQVSQCEKNIVSLQDELRIRNTETTDVIESLIRKQCSRELVDLRQQLASDGARLGRLVYNRAGIHTIENWEDGLISKNLKKKKNELRRRKEALLKLKNEQVENSAEHLELSDMYIQAESIEMQIKEIQRQEVIIEKDEESLYLEKASHIKSLKRLACEDASRFSVRPKLHDRYIPMSLLGRGGFSEVWLAYDLTELREVAVKIHQLDPRWSEAKIENYTKHVAREYEIHRDVRHPRIVSLYDVFEIDNNSFATVLEYCKGTDLDTLLKERKYLPEHRARLILLQILSGMKYLSTPSSDKSRQGIIHYDLKPGNILFDENGDAKITDFGLSKILDSQDPADSMELTSQGAGTYWYLPPECFVMNECVKISNKVDVWSIGVIFYQMLFGKRPFGDGQSQDKVLSNSLILNAREVRFPGIPSVSNESMRFIEQCLTYEQQNRPTITDLCIHPYVLQTHVIDTTHVK